MITILSNNYAGADDRLQTTWGFAALVETSAGPVLFDTGADGPILIANMNALGIDPAPIRAMVFSHEHWDHTGGIDEALAAVAHGCSVYMPQAFPDALKEKVRSAGGELVETTGPVQVCEGLTTTGVLDDPLAEQAIAIDSPGGVVVVTGCAHPGVEKMAAAAAEATGKTPELVLGGFHMKDDSEARIRAASGELRSLGVRRVGPTHCTGDLARSIFADEWGESCIDADLGARIAVDG